ncbi:MAG: hypothetical protein EBX41_10765, partial [Chitinophagia bacterium]|nr:hypothetical protein [Chitinophagia bacterium]
STEIPLPATTLNTPVFAIAILVSETLCSNEIPEEGPVVKFNDTIGFTVFVPLMSIPEPIADVTLVTVPVPDPPVPPVHPPPDMSPYTVRFPYTVNESNTSTVFADTSFVDMSVITRCGVGTNLPAVLETDSIEFAAGKLPSGFCTMRFLVFKEYTSSVRRTRDISFSPSPSPALLFLFFLLPIPNPLVWRKQRTRTRTETVTETKTNTMSSGNAGIRRTATFNAIKTRGLVLQNPDGTFPPANAVLQLDDSTGTVIPSRNLDVDSLVVNNNNLIIDNLGQITARSITLTSSATAITTTSGDVVVNDANVVVTGDQINTGYVSCAALQLTNPDVETTQNNTYLWVNDQDLLWQSEALNTTLNISQGIQNLVIDPSGVDLIRPTDSSDSTGMYNALVTILNIFNKRSLFIG